MVRDGIMTRVQALPFFATVAKFAKTDSRQIQPEDIPYVGVYLMSEKLTPDGDANAGEPRFRAVANIGFQVVIQNNDPDAAEAKLDKAFQALINGLLSDPTLYNNSEFRIQAYTQGERSHNYGSNMLDNELPVAELRFHLSCDLGTITYEPVVPDILETIAIDVVPLSDLDDAGVDRIHTQYEIDST